MRVRLGVTVLVASSLVASGATVDEVAPFAARTLLLRPSSVAIAPDGRVWATDLGPADATWGGSVVVLEDADRDGTAEAARPFLTSLERPCGLLPLGAGLVLVLEPPHLLLARDDDGDGRSDQVSVVVSGLDAATGLLGTADGSVLVAGTGARIVWGPDGPRITRLPGLLRTVVATADGGGAVTVGDGLAVRWFPSAALLPAMADPFTAASFLDAPLAQAPDCGAVGADGARVTIVPDSQPEALATALLRRPPSAAADGFAALSAADALPELTHPDRIRRALAARALLAARLRGDADPEALARALETIAASSRRPGVRADAWCLRSAAVGMDDATFRRWLGDEDATVRERAVVALALDGPTWAVETVGPILEALDDSAPNVRAAALLAAGRAVVEKWRSPSDRDRLRSAIVRTVGEHGAREDVRAAALAGLSGDHAEQIALLEAVAERAGPGMATWWLADLSRRVARSAAQASDPADRRAMLEWAASRSDTAPELATAVTERLAGEAGAFDVRPRRLRLDQAPRDWSPSRFGASGAALDRTLRWPDRPGVDPDEDRPSPEEFIALGRRLYSNCLTCHGPAGAGQRGIYPPLGGSTIVNGDPERFAKVLLHGLRGRTEVAGVVYDNIMPKPPIDGDVELAAVMTYVRQAFGNAASPVGPALVQSVRQANTGRREPWDINQLKAP
jgi:mono/diheme cytochrome c family protein